MKFNSKYPRVIRSKVQQRVSLTLSKIIFISSLALFSAGIGLLVFDMNSGWYLLAVSVPFGMFHLWYQGEVATVCVANDSHSVESLLSSPILAKLKGAEITLENVIAALNKTNEFYFMQRRLHLSEELLVFGASSLEQQDWWGSAVAIWSQNKSAEGVDASHIVPAIIINSIYKEDILTAAALTEEDLFDAMNWLHHWKDMITTTQNRRNKGGIARNWAVGYAPILDRFAYNISSSIQYGGTFKHKIFLHQQIVSQIHSALSSGNRSNILLVGETGVGKKSCVEAFADSLLFNESTKSPLRFYQIYDIDTIAMLTQLNNRNMLENALMRAAIEAQKAKNIILFFPDIANLFGIEGGIDLSATMTPIIQDSGIRMIFSATPGEWKWLQQNRPQLTTLLNFQAVASPGRDDVLKILQNKVIVLEHQYDCLFTYNSIKEVYRLSERYGQDVAMPAKAIQLLETVARLNAGMMILKESVALAVEKTTGVKAGVADENEKQSLLNLDELLHQRVIGQQEAIKKVVSALQRSRAGVSNQNKPIGTFLFLGPTGVGKTETAKAVARAYFGGEDRLIRVDMNEYVSSESLTRFLDSGTVSSYSLLDSIKKQPFSVVLLDEIEKAHPDVVNSLLQLLDEGVLRDTANREFSFRDAIVIATSNAGAETINAYEEAAKENPEKAKQAFVNQLIENGSFKPEFVNRFDTVVLYHSLNPEELMKVVDIQIGMLNQTLATQQLSVTLTEAARGWLAHTGYDPQMGARPLRRLVQDTVEEVVSKKILEGSVRPNSGTVITLDVTDIANT